MIKRIAVRPNLGAAQGVKTLVHELAHALLHADRTSRTREVEEVEVESVAYIVCDALGLVTGAYSFAYVTRWADGSTELVRDTAERAVDWAKQVLESMSAQFHN